VILKRAFALALSALFACAPVWSQQLELLGASNFKPSTAVALNGFVTPLPVTANTSALVATASTTSQNSMLSVPAAGTWASSSTSRNFPVPIPGTFFGMEVNGPSLGLTGAGTVNFNINAFGGTFSGTSPNCTLAAGQTTCADTAGCASGVAFCAHKLTVTGAPCATKVSLAATNSATALAGTLTGPIYMGTAFQSANANEGLIFGYTFSVPNTIVGWFNNFLTFSGTAEYNVQQIMPTSGTLDTLCVWMMNGGPSAGATYTVTMFKNGQATAVTCTVSNPASTCDTTAGCAPSVACPLNVAVSPGDTISFKSCPSNVAGCPAGSAANAGVGFSWSMRWLPATAKEAVVWASPLGNSGTTPGTTASTNYYNASNGSGNSTTPQGGANANIIPYVPTNITFKDYTVAWCWGTSSDAGRTFSVEATNTPGAMPATVAGTSGVKSGVTISSPCQTAGSAPTYLARDTTTTFTTTTPVTDNTLFDIVTVNGTGTHQTMGGGGLKQAFVMVVQ
jgi:hypothetical protein